MNSMASRGPADSAPKYCLLSNILVTLFIENAPSTSLKLTGFSVWDQAQTSWTSCWASPARWFAMDSILFFITQRSYVLMRLLTQLEKVAEYRQSWWAWRQPDGFMLWLQITTKSRIEHWAATRSMSSLVLFRQGS